MKTKLFVTAIAASAAAATSLVGFTAPAQSFAVDLIPDQNGIVKFEQDTDVTIKFLLAHGFWKANFGVVNLATGIQQTLFSENASYNKGSNEKNDWRSDSTNLATSDKATIRFAANVGYQFAIWGFKGNTTTPYFQTLGEARTGVGSYTFQSTGPNYKGPVEYTTLTASTAKSLIVGFEDGWEKLNKRGAGDFNDLIVEAQAEAVPEPITMGGLALGGAWLAYNRRRRSNKTA